MTLALLLQSLPKAPEIPAQVAAQNPVEWWIIGTLLFVVCALCLVIVYLVKTHKTELKTERDRNEELNEFIRKQYAESVGVQNTVGEGLKSLSEGVKENRVFFSNFLTEMRSHVSTLLNLPAFLRAAESRNEQHGTQKP